MRLPIYIAPYNRRFDGVFIIEHSSDGRKWRAIGSTENTDRRRMSDRTWMLLHVLALFLSLVSLVCTCLNSVYAANLLWIVAALLIWIARRGQR